MNKLKVLKIKNMKEKQIKLPLFLIVLINELIEMFDANKFLNEKLEVDYNLNSLIQGLNSTSEYDRLLDEINKILAQDFIQKIVYNNLQVSIFKRLKEHLSIDDENFPVESSEWNDKSMSVLKLTIQNQLEVSLEKRKVLISNDDKQKISECLNGNKIQSERNNLLNEAFLNSKFYFRFSKIFLYNSTCIRDINK